MRNYRIRLPGSAEAKHENTTEAGTKDGWVNISLPPRKEWVAAVPMDRLVVMLTPR